MKYAVKLIFLKCIFEFMINTAPPASNSVYGREKLFWYDKLILQIMCVTVVQWSRSCLHVQINRVRLPATLFNVSLYRFFIFLFGLFFNTIFPFGLFSLFLLLTLPVMHLDQWYFKLKSGVLFRPSWRPDKNHKPCQDMSLLWNSSIFSNVSWHHDKQHTVHHKLY